MGSIEQIVVGTDASSKSGLGLRIGVDALSAAIAAITVSPIVGVIDRSVVTKTATGQTMMSCLWTSLRPILKNPFQYVVSRPLRLIAMVYLGTYTAANVMDTSYSYRHSQPAWTMSGTTEKFLVTSAVSTGLCVYKDACFAQMFGAQLATTSRVPVSSYLLFTLRDAITIYGCFILPPVVATRLTELPPSVKKYFAGALATESSRFKTAQFLLPAAIQFVTTPIHLLGLDLNNRQQRVGIWQRLARVNRDIYSATPIRMLRIVPAFGIGGVVNLSMRQSLMQKLG